MQCDVVKRIYLETDFWIIKISVEDHECWTWCDPMNVGLSRVELKLSWIIHGPFSLGSNSVTGATAGRMKASDGRSALMVTAPSLAGVCKLSSSVRWGYTHHSWLHQKPQRKRELTFTRPAAQSHAPLPPQPLISVLRFK